VVSSLVISIGIDSCVLKRRRTHSTRRINSSGNRIVASHSARRNCLFADRTHRNDPSHPNRPIQRTKTHTPYPTQPNPISLVLYYQSRDFIPAVAPDPDPLSAAAHTPLLEMRQPPASLLAGAIKRRPRPTAAAGPGS
jgi:hypothetical protein